MSKIGEYEKTIVAEPIKEPVPKKEPIQITPLPVKKKDSLPIEVKPSR
jgi:hypothetical protein